MRPKYTGWAGFACHPQTGYSAWLCGWIRAARFRVERRRPTPHRFAFVGERYTRQYSCLTWVKRLRMHFVPFSSEYFDAGLGLLQLLTARLAELHSFFE